MTETTDLGSALRSMELGPDRFRILDVEYSTIQNRVLHTDEHWGVFYFLPPASAPAEQVKQLLDEYKREKLVHFSYNVQSSVGIEHVGVLTPDAFARLHFEKPPRKMLRLQWGHKKAWEELLEIFDQLKRPFDPAEFPWVEQLVLTDFKPPTPGRETMVTFRLRNEDWKSLLNVEEAIRIHVTEANYPRELYISRHRVKGLDAEIIMASTEATTEKGHAFLADLAEYLESHEADEVAPIEAKTAASEREEPSSEETFMAIREMTKGNKREPTQAEIEQRAMATLQETLAKMGEFNGRRFTVKGPWLEIEFPGEGLLGLKGHFEQAHENSLLSVGKVVHNTPDLRKGWSASYKYDKGSRLLRIKIAPENEEPMTGYKVL